MVEWGRRIRSIEVFGNLCVMEDNVVDSFDSRRCAVFFFILKWNIDKIGVQEVGSSLYIERNNVVNDVPAC